MSEPGTARLFLTEVLTFLRSIGRLVAHNVSLSQFTGGLDEVLAGPGEHRGRRGWRKQEEEEGKVNEPHSAFYW